MIGAFFLLSQLEFIAGCWHGAGYEERFTRPTANAMLGVSQAVDEGATRFFELLTITKRGDAIVYTPYVNGERSVDFTLVAVEGRKATFENPTHDFPQRIVYERAGDTLTARIEGSQNGQEARETFVMARRSCDE